MGVQELFATGAALNAAVDAFPRPVSAFEAVRAQSGRIADFVCVYANSAARAVLEQTQCELVGKTLREVSFAGTVEELFETFGRVVETGEPHSDPAMWWQEQAVDGTVHRRAFEVEASKSGDGFVLISREVTEEMIAAEMSELALEQERSLTRQLRDLDNSRAALIAAVTHDFRTPLTGIVGLSWLLESDWDELDDATRREYVHDILRSGEELDRRITTTLEHLRVESGNFAVQAESCNVRHEIARVLDRMRLMLDTNTVEFDVPEDVVVWADPTAFARVVENLLSNAVKYSPSHSTIGLHAERGDAKVTVSVADQGPGISDEDVHRIFDQFERLESGRLMAQGNGVGLSAVRQLVDLMQGDVWVERNVGGGSVFKFSLPVATGG